MIARIFPLTVLTIAILALLASAGARGFDAVGHGGAQDGLIFRQPFAMGPPLVERAIDPDPHARFPSAGEMEAAIVRVEGADVAPKARERSFFFGLKLGKFHVGLFGTLGAAAIAMVLSPFYFPFLSRGPGSPAPLAVSPDAVPPGGRNGWGA